MRTERRKRGDAGERHARAILEGEGLTWIESNWRCTAGEVDLVMRDGTGIVFVEVKVRRGEMRGSAEEAISSGKASKLLATGEWYMADHFPEGVTPWRIDLLALTLDGSGQVIRRSHVPNAIVSG
jgi:putative endonuclease